MSFGHWVEVCRHGIIQRQCSCPGVKDIRPVPCVSLSDPAWSTCTPLEMSLPDEATILMDDGVFHEEYR